MANRRLSQLSGLTHNRGHSSDSAYHSRNESSGNWSKRFSLSSRASSSDRASEHVGPLEHHVNPDPRSYSGKNPVPRIENLWDLYPGQQQDVSADGRDVTLAKIERKSKTVTDPVTGDEVRICDAKYAPPQEVIDRGKEEFVLDYWQQYVQEFRSITIKYVVFILSCFILLSGCFSLPLTVPVVLGITGGVTWWRKIESAWQEFTEFSEAERGRQRMLVKGAAGNESVEWLNGTIAKLWPQINADIFASSVDLLEDVMQASLPSVVSEVKVANMGQGSTPMRILSMRWLEDSQSGIEPSDVAQRMNDLMAQGEWVSLECAFAYRAQKSSASAASKAKNANLLIHFFVGVTGLIGKALPVWVELVQVTGTCRLKLQLVPDPPFIKLATVTLMGMPKLEVAAVPMNQHLFNVMNLPLISDFIYSSIQAALGAYIAPASYTLDLSKLLVGDDSKKDTRAIGVLVVRVRSATGIRSSDIDGKSDPYVTLSYSKFAKPLWSTRIIFNELEPIWDETAVLLVGTDELKAKERLSVELWDSDRFTADDICGRTEMDITELIREPGKIYKRRDPLKGFKEGEDLPGTVRWDVVYYGKRELNKELETKGEDERLPKDLRHLEKERSREARSPEDQVCFIPPERDYPSGILSVQIHNIVGLERHLVAGSKGDKNLQRGQGPEEEEEGESLPSAYCSIMLDYQKIYKTRVKPMTSKPFFNAGCERFIRCWHTSTVLVVVRDHRMREVDPILGVVELRLKDVFKNSSHTCHFYPIRGGVGYGKIRISLLFRAIDTRLPPQLLGADIGSLEICCKTISAEHITDVEVREADSILFDTPFIKKRAKRSEDGSGWAPIHNTHGSTGFRLGVRYRHSSACVLYFHHTSILRNKTLAVAVLWLKDIPDEEDVDLKLPVFRPHKVQQYIQNCGVPEEKNGTLAGYVHLKVRFHRGLGHSHRRQAAREKDFRDVMEAVSCIGHIRGESAPLHVEESEDEDLSSDEESPKSKTLAVEQEHEEGNERQQLHFSGSEDEADAEAEEAEAGEEIGKIRGIKRRLTKNSERRKHLHQKERGMMQWKGARTLAWVGRSVSNVPRRVSGKLRMEPRRPGVESEVRYMIQKLKAVTEHD